MSYKNLIDKSLFKTFNTLKDLASVVVLTKKNNPSFNFQTGQSEFAPTTTITTKAVITNSTKKFEDRNTIQKELMLKTKEVGDLTTYTTITINSEVWNIGGIEKNDGFVSLVKVFKEV
jgi:hypothetical protein